MKILVVDDEIEIRNSLKEILEDEGHEVLDGYSIDSGKTLCNNGIDLAFIDIKLRDENGLDLLKYIRQAFPTVPVIMISGHGTIQLTAEAFKLGARDFLEKPLRLVQIRTTLRNTCESIQLKSQIVQEQKNRNGKPVYKSALMESLYGKAKKLSYLSQPVVILGPSGSGKELLARSLHFDGSRAEGPFIVTNAASMPVTLAEDELFGHEKGAFTGAHSGRKGCIEQAHKGTLFLDEIADMDLTIQAKLLRALETNEFTKLGATSTTQVDVRIIAATHKNMEELVRKGLFRQDLWYRLCAFTLHSPPLDQHREDIPLLVESFLGSLNAQMGITKIFSERAIEYLTLKNYPGNIRELKHVVTRAVVFTDNQRITENDLILLCEGDQTITSPTATSNLATYINLDFKKARETFEIDYLSTMLKKHNFNITSTASAIGMAQSNLSRKIKELGLKLQEEI